MRVDDDEDAEQPMTTVFLSGSRKITRLAEEVRQRIDTMIEKDLRIITGDANGADRAMQAHLAERQYSKVVIYFVGDAPRNNVGNWSTNRVATDKRLSGRDFYAQKDRAMSKIADYGFVVWDGKSAGSVQNMLWLLQEGKPIVVYFGPERTFFNFRSEEELVELLTRCKDEVIDELARKISLPVGLKKSSRHQPTLNL